jgi:hypothetical protein
MQDFANVSKEGVAAGAANARRTMSGRTRPRQTRSGTSLRGAPQSQPQKVFPLVYLHYRIRKDKVEAHGKIALRYEGNSRHLGATMQNGSSCADRDVRVLSATTAKLLGHYLIDPAKNYQAKLATDTKLPV